MDTKQIFQREFKFLSDAKVDILPIQQAATLSANLPHAICLWNALTSASLTLTNDSTKAWEDGADKDLIVRISEIREKDKAPN